MKRSGVYGVSRRQASFLRRGCLAGRGFARRVDPMVGVVGHGACMPGPCLPHASIYPSPDTLKPKTSGFVYGDDVVGFSQLHTQGTGGTPTYGNFLVSPRLGPGVKEADHASPLADVAAACFAYRARLTRWDTRCTVVPAAHSALYRFEFPAMRTRGWSSTSPARSARPRR